LTECRKRTGSLKRPRLPRGRKQRTERDPLAGLATIRALGAQCRTVNERMLTRKVERDSRGDGTGRRLLRLLHMGVAHLFRQPPLRCEGGRLGEQKEKGDEPSSAHPPT